MSHNTKLAFRSLKKASEGEKLIQMEQLFKIIPSTNQSYTNMFFYFTDLAIKSYCFSHLEV